MSRQNILKYLFLSLVFSTLSTSCGLIEKFKTPEQPTDSKTSETEAVKDGGADDLFSQTMSEIKEDAPTNANSGLDAPSNINNQAPIANENAAIKDDLKSLEDEFSGNTSATTAKEVASKKELKAVKVEESLPEIKPEMATTTSENMDPDAGKMKDYKVQKGETLMQIAFKIYGDTSKWKQLKELNGAKISKNSSLAVNTLLKYRAPEKTFVWNPEGTPYLIKNGETLGTISNSVYQTPKKWKKLWENNKPLIKNPNVIYAGFTLFYKGDNLANYVQPKSIQKKKMVESLQPQKSDNLNIVEEVKVEQAISKLDESTNGEIDLTKDIQSAPIRNIQENVHNVLQDEIKNDEKIDEVLSK